MRDWLQEFRAAAAAGADAAVPRGFARPGEVIVLLQPAGLGRDSERDEQELEALLMRLWEKNFVKGEQRVGAGGIGGALVRACAPHATGFDADLSEEQGCDLADALFAERCCRALVTSWSSAHLATANFVDRSGRFTGEAIGRVTAGNVCVRWMGETVLATEIQNLTG